MTPTISDFDPTVIKFQHKVIYDIRKKFDYSTGVQEILLSGSVGSAKSLLMAHIIATHMILNPGAHVGIGRLSMPALKGTLFNLFVEHLGDMPMKVTENTAKVKLPNGSKLTSFSWQDKKYKKVRSHEFSMFAMEEGTENDTPDAYKEIMSRIGRMSNIDEKLMITATNPSDPSHWLYERFWTDTNEKRHVYLSNTFENPFLPQSYIDDLEKNFTEREARRMLHGEWLELSKDVVYYEYKSEIHKIDQSYQVDPRFPIYIAFDFNIGEGKPMSAVLFQYIADTFHFFDEIVIAGARTLDVVEEAHQRSLLNLANQYIICGDATGRARSTTSTKSNYDIIREYLSNIVERTKNNARVQFIVDPDISNPPIKTRHNLVNAYLTNVKKQHRVKVYKQCKVLDKGLRLTKLKPGGNYVEDDSKDYQHITTAAGYGIIKALRYNEKKASAVPRR